VDPSSGKNEALLTGLRMGDSLSVTRDGRKLLYTSLARFSHVALLPNQPNATISIDHRHRHEPQPQRFADGREIAYLVGDPPHADLFVMPRAEAGGGSSPRAER